MNNIQAQKPNVLFEVGVTYISNNLDQDRYLELYDFLAFTVNTRINLAAQRNSALSLDIPVSIRSKFGEETITRFGFHLPALLTYNIGTASSGYPSDSRFGFFIGGGLGYFYQQSKSDIDEFPDFNQHISILGPAGHFGIRFPLRKIVLWNTGDREVHPTITLRFLYQANPKDWENNIGGISIMAGMVF
jgi:hypothetical protein